MLSGNKVVWVSYNDRSGLGWDRLSDVIDEITHVYTIRDDELPKPEYADLIWPIDVKQQSIKKELELAETKKQRLENHINILKSKLK